GEAAGGRRFRRRGGVCGAGDRSWSINTDQDSYVSVYGSEGTLVVGWKGSRYRQDGSTAWVSFGAGYDKVLSLKKQLENFVASLRASDMPRISPEDALASVQVIESAYVSAGRNNWVLVEAPS